MKRFVSLLLVALLFTPVVVFAIDLGVGDGLAERAGTAAGYDPASVDETSFAALVGVAVQTAMAMLGVLLTALLVYGGFTWMIARGEEDKVTKAKGIIRMAIIGLLIVISAYSISYFVTTALIGAG